MEKNAPKTAKRRPTGVAAALMAIVLVITGSISSFADSIGGFTTHRDIVEARSTDVYSVVFRGREVARVAVKGDGDTDLDLYVYNSNGDLVAKDDDYTDTCAVRWVPRWTGRYTIRVVNRGNVYNEYVIATN